MAQPRMFEMTIVVEDDGGPEDYERIKEALGSIGADIIEEREV